MASSQVLASWRPDGTYLIYAYMTRCKYAPNGLKSDLNQAYVLALWASADTFVNGVATCATCVGWVNAACFLDQNYRHITRTLPINVYFNCVSP